MRSSLLLAMVALVGTLATACRDRSEENRPIQITLMPPLTVEGSPAADRGGDAGVVGTTTLTGADVPRAPAAAAAAAPTAARAPAAAPVPAPTASSPAATAGDGARADAGTRFEPSDRYGIISAPDLAKNLGMTDGTGSGGGVGNAATPAPAAGSPSAATTPPRPEEDSTRHAPPSAADPIPWTGSTR